MVKIRTLNDNKIFEGQDAKEIVEKMRDSVIHNQDIPLLEYMLEIKDWINEESLKTDSPENFLSSLESLGYIQIE